MNRNETISIIRDYLEGRDEVQFAYLFGSFVTGERFRDIDIAIFTDRQIDLLTLGTMKTELRENTGQHVDLVLLNTTMGNHPVMAFQIMTKGKPLMVKNAEQHTQTKKKVLLTYFDTKWLREEVNNAFTKRLKSGKFGQRNYE